jgi:hypothetical protein
MDSVHEVPMGEARFPNEVWRQRMPRSHMVRDVSETIVRCTDCGLPLHGSCLLIFSDYLFYPTQIICETCL